MSKYKRFRCSACNELTDTKTKIFVQWDQNGVADVQVCPECNESIKKSGQSTVEDFLVVEAFNKFLVKEDAIDSAKNVFGIKGPTDENE